MWDTLIDKNKRGCGTLWHTGRRPAEVPGKLLINPVQRPLSRTASARGQQGNNYPSRGEQVPCPPATIPELEGIFLSGRLCPVVLGQLMDQIRLLLVDPKTEGNS